MRSLFFALCVLTISACGSSTEPKADDPSLLFTNNLDQPVYLTWQDGQAILGRDTIPPHAVNHCSRFLAQPDSAYFQIVATEIYGGTPLTSTITASWFNPADRPAWTVTVDFAAGGSPFIYVSETDVAC
jgi:hypothetical protein